MSPTRLRPSVLQIVKTDYLAMLAIIIPVVLWVMYGVVEFRVLPSMQSGEANALDPDWLLRNAAVATMIGLPVLVWRMRAIRLLFAEGVEVPGTITQISFVRDRGSIEFEFEHDGETYQVGNALHKSKRVAQFAVGNSVTVVLNPEQPKKAKIRDFYES